MCLCVSFSLWQIDTQTRVWQFCISFISEPVSSIVSNKLEGRGQFLPFFYAAKLALRSPIRRQSRGWGLLWGVPQMKQSIHLKWSRWDRDGGGGGGGGRYQTGWRKIDKPALFFTGKWQGVPYDTQACEGLPSLFLSHPLSRCLSFFNTSARPVGLWAFKWSEFCNMAVCPSCAVKFGRICFREWKR